MKSIYKLFVAVLFVGLVSSCNDELNINPNQSIDSATLVTDASSASVAMSGLYSRAQDLWRDQTYFNIDVLSDITDHVGTFVALREFQENNVFPDNGQLTSIWNNAYELIYGANLIIDVLPGVEDAALDAVKDQYIGEARALRAYAYYYLANVFGDVPLITTPVKNLDEINVPLSAYADVLNQAISDLNAAEAVVPSGAATRISKGAINAMLAKVYMTLGNWPAAGTAADKVIVESYSLVPNYMDLYNGSISSEAIFQLDFNSTDANSLSFFYWDKPGGRHEIAPSQAIVDAYEAGDARRAAVGDAVGGGGSPYYCTKWSDFATGTDKPIVLRLADVLLIKAESLAEAGNLTDATTIVNQIRTRAGLSDVTLDAGNYKSIILKERMIELAWEGGHRWFDMLRSGEAEAYVTGKGQDVCQIRMPIPRAEVDANTAVSQSPCY